MPDFRADVFDALMTRLEAFGDHSARLARTEEQKALAESFGALVAEVDTAIRYTAEATAQHGHPLAAAKLQADNAQLREALLLTQQALNTAPRFRVGDTDSYKIASAVDKALAAAEPPRDTPASDYARTLDGTARRAQQRDPDRGIDR
jgi:hypothetical protein